ncbi:TIGR01841 family phasin [Noviherbaspirillum autotrophicum]|uniref:Phasin (PHA-granule associated protein) n=1 Tax=Noviherbaspirillum autotrophicum TaxID=709839 RepID=A0A0C2BPS4_9BURK|nr:TIGR01841 family phasin [Noviherbaspirillum autotrophicum]KIF82084.1 Phasin (PHA-granule associated protein) [Noviherbaspirillum autotrophicum]
MFPIQNQISAATKNSLEAHLALYASLTNKTFESIEKLVTLNITAVKASMEESSVAARQMLAAKDPQEFLAVVTAQSKPALEKAVAYGNHVSGIASSAHAEFVKAAEVQMAAVASKVNELLDEVSKKAPAGTEGVVAMVKTALDNANGGYEQFASTAKQAKEVLEANVNAAVGEFVKTATHRAA